MVNYSTVVSAVIYIIWNFVVFSMYGADKRNAAKGRWRTREKTLLFAAFIMGGVGALAGMKVFRHKTKHPQFVIGVPLAVIFNAAVLTGIWYLCGK
ncbi:MAG: DUF1294 domain-containing protein [Clostridiales bacterium]|jgi:uncharacterized membrane protein YsdA (DUF1294 family)|nr:DUF1294 domain-containing protein [Clostridiales bacterium]